MRRRFALVCLILLNVSAIASATDDTCLMFAARNIAKGGGNFFIYCPIVEKRIDIRAGDALEYDVYLFAGNPMPVGGIDIDTDRGNLRDAGAVDQDNVRAHGDATLDRAKGKWYHRRIPLDALAGQKTRRFNAVFEGDKDGSYAQFLDNIVIVHADGKEDVVYDHGDVPQPKLDQIHREGYSRYVALKSIPRDRISDGADLAKFLDQELNRIAVKGQLDEIRAEVEIVHKFADKSDDQHMKQHADEARQLLDQAEKNQSLDAEAIQSLIHQVDETLNHEHPEMQKYTGHLVGHAHIDFQWLWPWTETIQVCHDTFNQALKFMDEFPGFKFSQSSSSLYAATEENFPDIFKGIQKQVEAGNWELVGGRVCEGDEHMISPESHARHFLYGQRYFREHFNGKDAIVGWEPDTFGHTWQMPQILQLGGCKYFYFCRGGKHQSPLFWWQAPDGSKVLAFEEPATGGWYNGDVASNRFDRLLDFADKTGAKDMLWVYGVGNHGGGPTRENINAAINFQKSGYLPNVKFSTATEFFKQLEKYDLSKIPTVNGDLTLRDNAGFYGTYTTHSDLKRWNREAEATTESAEAIAAIASRYGFTYPTKEFRRNWEDICWNHHHDTLPGTSIHPSYDKSEAMFTRVIASSKNIAEDALAFIADKVKSTGDDAVLVFNPCGFARSGTVTAGGVTFFADDVPSLGYRVYHTNKLPEDPAKAELKISDDGTTLDSAEYRVTVNPAHGVVTSIFDKKANRETLAKNGSGNRLEIHWEEPNGMSAWVIGKISKVEPLDGPVTLKVAEKTDVRVAVTFDRQFKSTTLHQTIALPVHGAPEFSLDTQWKELGSGAGLSPFLKVAFDIDAKDSKFTCQIPYGTITKRADGTECPALKFADLSDDHAGASILNDCKYGYSAEHNTVRLSLIRSSHNPDPRPNDRPQSAKWGFLPHAGALEPEKVVPIAEAFNHPLWQRIIKPNPQGFMPAEYSFCSMPASNAIITGVKQAEDDKDLVVRFYETSGRTAPDAKPKLTFNTLGFATVNFVEDPLKEVDPASALRSHEIRTLKIAAAVK